MLCVLVLCVFSNAIMYILSAVLFIICCVPQVKVVRITEERGYVMSWSLPRGTGIFGGIFVCVLHGAHFVFRRFACDG